jgi:hypothetical protein
MAEGVFRLPASTSFTPEQALHSILNDDLQDVLICGYGQDGHLVIRSSRMTCAEAAFLANKAFQWAQNGGSDE